MSAGMMARVSGMRRRSVVPLPARESISTLPPIFSTLVRTTSMPTPRPLTLVTAAAVEKPGRKISCSSSRSPSCAARSGVISPRSMALLRIFSTAMPAPSSETSMMTWLPSCSGAQRQRALGILARGLAHVGRLDAVIERVAHGVGQRILDGFEQALVELRFLALHLQAHAAAERLREVAHHARHLGEDVGDGLHARLHHGFAQIGGDHVEAAREQRHVGIGGRGLQHLVAGEHQLAHQIHHAVEQGHVDAQRAFRSGSLRTRF